jgi:DNA-binding NarL/FixJ family response regulator
VIVDDNALFREGVVRIMEGDPRLQVIGQAERGDDAVRLVDEQRPDLVLMDLRMPGLNGVEAIRRIRGAYPGMAIGVLTVFDSGQLVEAALSAGADGYILKDSTPHQLTEAAVSLARTRRTVSAPEESAVRRLTPRELEVLRALATGASNAAIAGRLGISQKTLRNHISNTYHKLEIFDRAQAVLVAVQRGLLGARPIEDTTESE